MSTNNHHEIRAEIAGVLHSALDMYNECFPAGSIPAEIEEWLVMVVPDMGAYYAVRVYYPAPKGQAAFVLFEARVDKQTATCEVTVCRSVAEIPLELIEYPKENDPV